MGNCLVTKLKGVVDNKNLPLLGYYRFSFAKMANNSKFVFAFQSVYAKARIYDANMNLIKEDHCDANQGVIYIPTAEGYVDVESYKLTNYIEEVAAFKEKSIKCSDIPYYFPQLGDIRLTYNKSLYGDVTELISPQTALGMQKLMINGQQYVTGTLESLCEKMFNAGRTSGEFVFTHESDNYRPHASMVSFHRENKMAPNCTITFNATGCEVYGTRAGAVVGTLSNGVWTYA